MTRLHWRYDAPFIRPGTTAAYTDNGNLVGGYRKRFHRYLVTYNLITTEAAKFRTEDEARDHLQQRADRVWPS